MGQLTFLPPFRMLGYRQYHPCVALPRLGTTSSIDFDSVVSFDHMLRNLALPVVPNAMVTRIHPNAAALSHSNLIGPDAFPVRYKQGKSC
jgi:hypothetical protein